MTKKGGRKHCPDLKTIGRTTLHIHEPNGTSTSDEDISTSSQRTLTAVDDEQSTQLTSPLESSIPDDAHNLDYIEVRTTETKGQAIFAIRKIKPGTLILSEKPMIRLTQAEEDADKDRPDASTRESALDTNFNLLSRSLQKAYLKLFDSKKSEYTRIKSIYYSNCYNISLGINRPSQSSPGGSAIGLLASRVNHSCLPNVQFSFDEEQGLMLFHAIKAITKGREIVSNYDNIYELRAGRQRRQMLFYGFKCDCEACGEPKTEFWAKSDERRRDMIEATREIKTCETAFDQKTQLSVDTDPCYALERLEALLIKEGLVGIPLADLYRTNAKWAERKGDKGEASGWKLKELEVCKTCLGPGSFRVRSIELKMKTMHE